MPELDEKDFIHEEYGKDPAPFWVWSFIVLLASVLIWLLTLWYGHVMDNQAEQNPFLQVTNREFSLFLWQNPEYMRVHVKNKAGYLPAFKYIEKIGLDPEKAEEMVQAPPEVLFLYHTWHRLLGNVVFERPIYWDQFIVFLNDAEEWKPQYWPDAPAGYVTLVNGGNHSGNMQGLPLHVFPREVRQAFVGWLNYFKEGELINAMRPNDEELADFLEKHPQYKRSLWSQIVDGYLQSSDELAPFLRAAIFNEGRIGH